VRWRKRDVQEYRVPWFIPERETKPPEGKEKKGTISDKQRGLEVRPYGQRREKKKKGRKKRAARGEHAEKEVGGRIVFPDEKGVS